MGTQTPTFILGIHHFCDHRCWRCAMRHRCAVVSRLTDRPTLGLTDEPAGRVAAVTAVSLEVTLDELTAMRAAFCGGNGPEQDPAGPANNDEDRAVRAGMPIGDPPVDLTSVYQRAERDPLVIRGAEYAKSAWRILRALRIRLARQGDTEGSQAAERLEETCMTIASKTFRAVSSAMAPDCDPADVQSDANGSAKVALLLIEEARRDWRVLMRDGRAIANGAPASLVGVLETMEREISARFPRALEFIRPGFDTNGQGDDASALAQAMLNARAMGPAH
jgi:hypothetical protein